MMYISLIVCLITSFQRLLKTTNQLCKIRASVFHTVVHWQKLGELESECILRNSIVLAIFLPEILQIGLNLT